MKTAFLFPGQGAQYVGMAKDFYEKYDECRKIIDEADAAVDFDLKSILFEENELINKTEYTQAAILAAECCILEMVQTKVKPDITAGLSLGEYAALVCAGAMSFSNAMKLVRKRGLYMENEVQSGVGTMAAILGLDGETVEGVCEKITAQTGKIVSPANYNCPGQIVISGYKEAVEAAEAPLKEAGARAVTFLKVSGPFHSQMLKGAGDKLAEELSKVNLADPVIPYINNADVEVITSADKIADSLRRQVSSPVKWQQTIEKMQELGVETYYEIGPGKTLSGFMKRIDRAIKIIKINTVEEFEQL